MPIDLHSCGPLGNLCEADLSANELPEGIVWIDLLSPTPEETAFVSRATGLDIATRDELSEIETSSRLRSEKGVLYLSMPALDGWTFSGARISAAKVLNATRSSNRIVIR